MALANRAPSRYQYDETTKRPDRVGEIYFKGASGSDRCMHRDNRQLPRRHFSIRLSHVRYAISLAFCPGGGFAGWIPALRPVAKGPVGQQRCLIGGICRAGVAQALHRSVNRSFPRRFSARQRVYRISPPLLPATLALPSRWLLDHRTSKHRDGGICLGLPQINEHRRWVDLRSMLTDHANMGLHLPSFSSAEAILHF